MPLLPPPAAPVPGISWADRNAYCVPGNPSPAQLASLTFYQRDCVMPLGQMFWVLAVQVRGLHRARNLNADPKLNSALQLSGLGWRR